MTLDGEPVRFPTRHAELIVYLLALAGSDGLSKEELTEAVWPAVEPPGALPRLRTALWQVRRALGSHAGRIERERGSVRLDLTGATVDLAAGRPLDRTVVLVGWNVSMPQSILDRVA